MSKITIWKNYHSDGWQPEDYETEQEAVDAILTGEFLSPIRITREVKLKIEVAPPHNKGSKE